MCVRLRAWPRLFREVNAIYEGRLSRHLSPGFLSVTALHRARSYLLRITGEVQRLRIRLG